MQFSSVRFGSSQGFDTPFRTLPLGACRGGFKYAAHTPAAVCGWRPEQNLATAVPESVPVNVCVCGSLCVRFVIIFIDVTGSMEL